MEFENEMNKVKCMKCEICKIEIDKVYQLIISPDIISLKSRYDSIPIKLPIEKNLKVLKVCKECQAKGIRESNARG